MKTLHQPNRRPESDQGRKKIVIPREDPDEEEHPEEGENEGKALRSHHSFTPT